MDHLKNIARKYLATSRLLGVRSASKLYLKKTLLPKDRESAMPIRLEGLASEFWVRLQGSDMDVVHQIFSARDYDLSWCLPYKLHIQAVRDRVREQGLTPVIIDAGANIGASTLWFALNFPDCHVLAVEPDRRNFEVLRRNVGSLPNMTLFHAALWDSPAVLSMVSDTDSAWACRFTEDGTAQIDVPTVTVPELLARDERFRPVIVKIDIEGAETGLFRSNAEWVDDVPLLIFEPHDNLWPWLGTWQGTGHAFFSVLARRKREYLMRGENVLAFLHPEAMG